MSIIERCNCLNQLEALSGVHVHQVGRIVELVTYMVHMGLAPHQWRFNSMRGLQHTLTAAFGMSS